MALQAALEEKKKYPFIYDPARSEALKWLNNHAAELVTNLAQEQINALNAIVYHFSGYESASPDEVARQMRAVIGLTRPQAIANARYYESVKTAWLKANPKGRMSTAEKYAREAAAKYAGKQHRYRAKCIARTELAFGYNAGLYGAAKDAQAQGYIGDCKKRWVTAHDGPPNRVCPECEKLDGVMVGMDDYFSINALIPPGHPQCRCVVDFVEIPALVTPPPVDIGGESDKLELNQDVSYEGIPKKWKHYAELDDSLQSVNPNYTSKDVAYKTNCTNCVPAYEMRRRGYDVTAMPSTKNHYLRKHPEEAWMNADVKKTQGSGLEDIINLTKGWPDGARAEVAVTWQGSTDGHVFVFEKVNKELRFCDVQSGKVLSEEIFQSVEKDKTYFWRIDNLELSDRGITACKAGE